MPCNASAWSKIGEALVLEGQMERRTLRLPLNKTPMSLKTTRILGACLLSALLSAPTLLTAQSTITDNINVDGTNRSYRLRVPAGADTGPARPLIINMHGFAGNASGQESSSGMNAIADTAGFYVAYPNAQIAFLFLQGWDDDISVPGNDDVAFIDDLITALGAGYNIDTSKVYATGFSNGGGMSVALGCALSGRIKGIAPVAAAIDPVNASACNPSVFRPLLQIHGTADGVVPIEGAPASIFYNATAPAIAFFRAWISGDACSAPVFTNLPNTVPGDGSTVTLAELNSCSSGQSYRFYRVDGGDHSIPGPGGQNKDLYASAAIWDFFRSQGAAFALPPALSREAQISPVAAFPNPAQDMMTFTTGTSGAWQAMLVDAAGRTVDAWNGSGEQAQRNLAALPNGLYTLQVGSNLTRVQVLR